MRHLLRRTLEKLRMRFGWKLAVDAHNKPIYEGSLVDDLVDPYPRPMYVVGILNGSLTVKVGEVISSRHPRKVIAVGWRA